MGGEPAIVAASDGGASDGSVGVTDGGGRAGNDGGNGSDASVGVTDGAGSAGNDGGDGSDAGGVTVSLDGGFTGIVLCDTDAAIPSGQGCLLEATLQGGLTETFVTGGCGSDEMAMINWQSVGGHNSPIDLITIVFPSRIPIDQLGTFPLDYLEVQRDVFGDGGLPVSSSWKTPQGACTVTVTGTICLPPRPPDTKHERILYGSGGCSQPAAPELGTDAGPVTISEFTFAAETVAP